MSSLTNKRVLSVPRGNPGQPALELDLTPLDSAEKRLYEVRLNNSAIAKDLEGTFNEAANLASKYLAWVEYEILQAQKNHDLNRAVVILEVIPEKAKELKELGIKMNEDYREAMITRDENCAKSLDVLNSLKAVQALLKASLDTFVRAHYSSRNNDKNQATAPTPNFTNVVGEMPMNTNLMGKTEVK
jgi:hypothetical protein